MVEQCFSDGAAVSVITMIEVLGWRGHDVHSRAAAELLLRGFKLIDLTQEIVVRTIALRSQRAIKLPDAVIAASALVAGCRLLTRNLRDFDWIGGLDLRGPFASSSPG